MPLTPTQMTQIHGFQCRAYEYLVLNLGRSLLLSRLGFRTSLFPSHGFHLERRVGHRQLWPILSGYGTGAHQ